MIQKARFNDRAFCLPVWFIFLVLRITMLPYGCSTDN
jgi:hypothetical protein